MSFLAELWDYMRHRKKFWLLPLLLVLLLFGGLIVLAKGSAILRDMASKQQREISLANIESELTARKAN